MDRRASGHDRQFRRHRAIRRSVSPLASHRGCPWAGAFASGAAIALAQTLGIGLATGSIARWRALPELAFSTVLKITNFVSFSFIGALGILTVALLAPPGAGTIGATGFSVLAVAGASGASLLSLIQPRRQPFPIPPLRLMLSLARLTVIDTALAAPALLADRFLPFAVRALNASKLVPQSGTHRRRYKARDVSA